MARFYSPACKRSIERLWLDFFRDPSKWWDKRSEKVNERFPDFKHKNSEKGLWLDGKFNPPWVEAKLATLVSGTLQPNNFMGNTRLAHHVKAGQFEKAIELFQQMNHDGMIPDRFTFVPVINACASLRALDEGRRIHAEIIRSGCKTDVFLGNSLVDMYARCGSIGDAMTVFNKMPVRNVASWNAIILGHVQCKQAQKALELFQQMQLEGVQPVPVTFVGVVNACAKLGALDKGRYVHELITQSGCESDVYVGSSLIDMYGKCRSPEDARRIFNRMPMRSLVSWNTMLRGYVRCGEGQNALELLRQMEHEGVKPNNVTFLCVINACASVGNLEEGRHVHQQVIQNGSESDIFICSSLVDMYAKCGSIEDARKVFDKMHVRNVVAWNAMIHGYLKCGEGQKALELSRRMQGERVKPVPVTFVGWVNACASEAALDEGKRVHDQVIEFGCETDIYVGSSLVDMYAKCGSLEDALRVFNKMPIHDVFSWNAIILGHLRYGHSGRALELYQQMQEEGVEPDSVTFVRVLNACATLASLGLGELVHQQILRSGWELDVFVGSSLVDMYSKCGNIDSSWRVFKAMPTRNFVAWNAMLGGYALHGLAKEALRLFERMCEEGIEIGVVTFVSLLSNCSHGGLVNEGFHYFESMSQVYGLHPTVEHYACMVDLLGRAGRIHEAADLVQMMPCNQDAAVWTSLLGACRVHGNMEMGELVAKQVLELDPGNASGYVLLSNIFAAADKWDSSANIQKLRVERGIDKEQGCTWLEVGE